MVLEDETLKKRTKKLKEDIKKDLAMLRTLLQESSTLGQKIQDLNTKIVFKQGRLKETEELELELKEN